ncbi:hypothetical protein Tco_0807207 [Tanacetum coccineum]
MTPKEIICNKGLTSHDTPSAQPEEQRMGIRICEYNRQKGYTNEERGKKAALETRWTTTLYGDSHGSGKTKAKSQPILCMEVASLFHFNCRQRVLSLVVGHLPSEINAAGHDIHRMYIDGGASAGPYY